MSQMNQNAPPKRPKWYLTVRARDTPRGPRVAIVGDGPHEGLFGDLEKKYGRTGGQAIEIGVDWVSQIYAAR